MSLDEIPWKFHHHRSYFLPNYQMVEDHFEMLVSYDIVNTSQSLTIIHNVESEGNLSNITKTTLINISVKPRVFENVHLGHKFSSPKIKSYMTLFREFRDVFSWTYE